MKEKGGMVKTFAPAYSKVKNAILPNHVFKRRAGESFGGSLTPSQRREATIVDLTFSQNQKLLRQYEWMARELLKYGKITIKGDDYPEVTVDFERDNANTLALESAKQWGEEGVSPIDDIQDWIDLAKKPIRNIVLGKKAWGYVRKDLQLKDMVDTTLRNGSAAFNLAPENADDEGVRYLGTFGTGIDLYLYMDDYEDTKGETQSYVDDHDVFLIPSDGYGIRCYGAIIAAGAEYMGMPTYIKNYQTDDPEGEFILTQSAPLPVHIEMNSTVYVKVR
jgi:hypothetical protein